MTSEFAGQSCGIYPRVSSRKQSKKDKTSLADQEQACRDYARELGMLVDEACVKPEAYTSTVMKRPELNLLLAEMKARHVRNLLIDRADRMTRAGQLVAAQFLRQFTRAGITLHIVASELVVRDDKGVHDFLEAAWQAQQDNKQRARIVQRAKRSRARAGHYLRGNKAPYGFRYVASEWDDEGNVTDKRLEPDERPFAELGYPTVFAAHPYAARKKIIALYTEQSMSPKRIAELLTQEGVPTAAQMHRHGQTLGKWWPWVVLHKIILAPLNEGVLTNFRHTYSVMDPDDKHDEEWVRATPTPLDKQVIVKPTWLDELGPLVDEPTVALIHARRTGVLPGWGQHNGGYADRALLAGRVVCTCGAAVRIRSFRRRGKLYLYYSCNMHAMVPSACPGWSLPVRRTDLCAWNDVLAELMMEEYTPGGHLQVLAERQAQRDTSEGAAESLADLRAVRATFQQNAETLAADVATLPKQARARPRLQANCAARD